LDSANEDDFNADDDDSYVPDVSADFYPPDKTGPYAVGVETRFLVDEDRYEQWGKRYRTLPFEIWYPSTGQNGSPNTMEQMFGTMPDSVVWILEKVFGDGFDELWGITTDALRNADVADAKAPYPVIFFSHGFLGFRFQNYTMCEHLAGHGFVVVGVDHYGNSLITNLTNTPGGGIVPYNIFAGMDYEDRVEDVAFAYRQLQEINGDEQDSLYGMLDLDRFGIAGHSMGGATSILTALDFDFVKAAAPLNPAWYKVVDPPFNKPLFLLTGEQDKIVTSISNKASKTLFDDAATDQKIFVHLKQGGHFSSTDVCTLVPKSLGFLAEECAPPFLDVALANSINNAYMTAFFKTVFYEDTDYQSYLSGNWFEDDIEFSTSWKQ
jgi:dienelactone hydrolase